MVQFGDKGGACDNTDSDVRETTLEPQNDSIVVGKKRPPSTSHPETLGETKKRSPEKFRRNEGNHMDGQLLTCNTEQNIDKVTRSSWRMVIRTYYKIFALLLRATNHYCRIIVHVQSHPSFIPG